MELCRGIENPEPIKVPKQAFVLFPNPNCHGLEKRKKTPMSTKT